LVDVAAVQQNAGRQPRRQHRPVARNPCLMRDPCATDPRPIANLCRFPLP
jgi:hypothetical protein